MYFRFCFIIQVTAHRLRGSGDYSPVKFSIDEVQSTAKRTG